MRSPIWNDLLRDGLVDGFDSVAQKHIVDDLRVGVGVAATPETGRQ
jgi:hypothetical protein